VNDKLTVRPKHPIGIPLRGRRTDRQSGSKVRHTANRLEALLGFDTMVDTRRRFTMLGRSAPSGSAGSETDSFTSSPRHLVLTLEPMNDLLDSIAQRLGGQGRSHTRSRGADDVLTGEPMAAGSPRPSHVRSGQGGTCADTVTGASMSRRLRQPHSRAKASSLP
jgi:hypothetical protein